MALLSWHRVFALYEVGYWKYPFNQPDECFRGSIEPHMHRISSELSGEAEKWSNCQMWYQYTREFGGSGTNGEVLHEIIDK